MKLRQKLAMVLAASMIVTAVPVTTMAYSKNQITNIMSAIKGQTVSYEDGLKLVLDFEDSIQAPFDTKEETAVVTMKYLGEKLAAAIKEVGESSTAAVTLKDDYKAITGVAYVDGQTLVTVDYSNAANATMFYLDATDFTFNKEDYMNTGSINKAYISAQLTTLKTSIDARVQTLVGTDNVKNRATTTPAGAVEKVEAVTIEDANISKTIGSGDTVATVKVQYWNADGELATKTIDYTREMLEALDKEDTIDGLFEQVDKLYEAKNPIFVFDGNAKNRLATSFNGTVIAEYLSNGRLRVYVIDDNKASNPVEGTKVGVPLIGKMTGESPVVKVNPLDSASSASASIHYLTKEAIGSEALTVEVKEAAKITVNGGKIADFTITENKEDALKGDTTIVLDLGKYSDLEFSTTQEIKLTGKNAFEPGVVEKATYKVSADGQKLQITIPDSKTVGTTTGAWNVSGVKVEAKSLKYGAEVGDVNIAVTSGYLNDKDEVKEHSTKLFDGKTIKFAEVVEFGVTIDVKPAQLIAGRVNDTQDKEKKAKLEEAVITLTEGVNESFDDKRWAYFEMPEGVNVKVADFNAVEKSVKINGDAADPGAAKFKLDTDKEGVYVKGFSIEFEYTNNTEDKGKMVVDKANKVEFTIPFCAPLGTEPGEYNLQVISKYMPELEGEIKVAEVVAPIEVTFEQKDVKVGLEKQEMGNITITETADKMIREGELVVYLDDIKLETAKKDIVLETTEGSKMDVRVKSVTSDKDGSTIVLVVDREAKEKAAITIKGLVGTVYRTVPEGGTDILVSGSSILDTHCTLSTEKVKDNLDYITVEDYNAVPTKNTEDINNASKLNTVKITANATSYEVNGETKEITSDLVAFNSANGRMLAPVRLVGTAFGAEFSYGTINNATVVTFFKDGKAVSFTNGSTVMNVNGVQSVMAEAATIKEGRLFVPLRDLANALGIKVNYDEATKTAEFTNAEK